MFVGHTALALAAKRRAPDLSLGWLYGAAITLDLLWPLFLLLGVEQVAIGSATGGFDTLTFTSYPWSHSLLTSVGWGIIVAAIARVRGIRTSHAILLALLVVSHWVLDFVTHAPDLPLFPGSTVRLGLGLWGSVPASYVVEGVLYAGGIWLYTRGTAAKDRIGSFGLWLFLLVSALMWASGPLMPPPPGPMAVAWSTMIAIPLLVVWAGWVDRHR
ncbi:MAG TPA: hypothetical protein VFI13_13420, partial [Gemmatimonadales bacterium]|nr:hypothetical protein [Gemmatimonadales bacterium]